VYEHSNDTLRTGKRDAWSLESARPRRVWQTLPWLVVLAGTLASIFMFATLREAVEDVVRLRFERQASDARAVIEGRIHSYTSILYALRALFATHTSVSRMQFHRFVNALDLKSRYPGFEVVNYAAYVPAGDIDAFVQSVRSDESLVPGGYPGFAVKPAGERPEYFVIAYLEPMAGQEFAFGRDLGANPGVASPQVLAQALRSARDTGKLTASGLPIRIHTDKEFIGLAMRMPVYRLGMPLDSVQQRRAAYVGSVGAGFNIAELMAGALSDETREFMRFRLYDVGFADGASVPPASQRLLFDSREGKASAGETTDLQHVLPFEVGGRRWEMHFSAARHEAVDLVDSVFPWAVLTGGILSSLLLGSVLLSLSSSRSRALTIATEMTSHLRESEANLVEAHALLNDAQKLAGVGCCHYEPGTGRVVWSEELYRIHGVTPETFTPTYESTMALVHPEDRASWAEALAQALRTTAAFASEFRIVRPDGSVRHLRSLGELMLDNTGTVTRMLWSALDITEQKRTEDALRASADQLTALSRRLVEVQEAERRQLSRELHDRVGQNLTALSINLDILRTSLGGGADRHHAARLSDSTALLESTADSIEDVMAELRPPMLDDYGLYPALNWYAKRFSERTGIEVEVLGSESAERPVPEIEITLFRIAQEALNNVAKHAQATRVHIDLTHAAGKCVMTVTDDGIGIDGARVADVRQRRGLGMVTMRERTQAVGGRFNVRNVPDGGTQIAIEVPT
jgi:PAS domain S-box-containing protein